MAGHYITKRLRSGRAAWRMAALALALMFVIVPLYRLSIVGIDAVFGALCLAALLSLAALLVSLATLGRIYRRGHHGGGPAVRAFILALVLLTPFVLVASTVAEDPVRTEAETSGMAVLEMTAQGRQAAGAGTAAAQGAAPANLAAMQIAGRRYEATAPAVFTSVRDVLAEEGWTVQNVQAGPPEDETSGPRDLGQSGTVLVPIPTPRESIDRNAPPPESPVPDVDEFTVQALARSFVFGFPSEIVIRIVENGGETFVEMRSRSTLLPNDFGQNRRFIEDFMRSLDDAMTGEESLSV